MATQPSSGASQPVRSHQAFRGSRRWSTICPLTILAVHTTQHFSQGSGCSDLLTEGGHSTMFSMPSPVNQRLWAISDNEWYPHLIRDTHGDLQEQGKYAQCETQIIFEGHALAFHKGMDGCPDSVLHVGQCCFHLFEEIGQPPVILQLVIVHHLVHLLPCRISFRMEVAHRSLTFCLHDVVP